MCMLFSTHVQAQEPECCEQWVVDYIDQLMNLAEDLTNAGIDGNGDNDAERFVAYMNERGLYYEATVEDGREVDRARRERREREYCGREGCEALVTFREGPTAAFLRPYYRTTQSTIHTCEEMRQKEVAARRIGRVSREIAVGNLLARLLLEATNQVQLGWTDEVVTLFGRVTVNAPPVLQRWASRFMYPLTFAAGFTAVLSFVADDLANYYSWAPCVTNEKKGGDVWPRKKQLPAIVASLGWMRTLHWAQA
jgi:hypothetical protein